MGGEAVGQRGGVEGGWGRGVYGGGTSVGGGGGAQMAGGRVGGGWEGKRDI